MDNFDCGAVIGEIVVLEWPVDHVTLEDLFPVLWSNRHFDQISLTEQGTQTDQISLTEQGMQTVFMEESMFQLTVGDIAKLLHSEHISANLMGC